MIRTRPTTTGRAAAGAPGCASRTNRCRQPSTSGRPRNPPRWRIQHGDCLRLLPKLQANSIDAIITDPPYGLEFMGKEWDSFRSDDPGTNRHRGEYSGSHGIVAGRHRRGKPPGKRKNRCLVRWRKAPGNLQVYRMREARSVPQKACLQFVRPVGARTDRPILSAPDDAGIRKLVSRVGARLDARPKARRPPTRLRRHAHPPSPSVRARGCRL